MPTRLLFRVKFFPSNSLDPFNDHGLCIPSSPLLCGDTFFCKRLPGHIQVLRLQLNTYQGVSIQDFPQLGRSDVDIRAGELGVPCARCLHQSCRQCQTGIEELTIECWSCNDISSGLLQGDTECEECLEPFSTAAQLHWESVYCASMAGIWVVNRWGCDCGFACLVPLV